MTSQPDRRRGINQPLLPSALRPGNITASPLSFARSAPATSLSAPYTKRRCVSTGSIPSADDPFSNASNSSDDGAVTTRAAVSYPALPNFQAYHNEGSPASSHANTPNNATVVTTTPSRSPRIRNRAVSDTQQLRTPPKEPKDCSASEVDMEIRHWIGSRLPETESNETGVGNNYTFEAILSSNTTTPGIRLVKIGYTSKRPRVRAARIQYECGEHEVLGTQDASVPTEEQDSSSRVQHHTQPIRPVRLFKRVERLAHAHFMREIHLFTCKACGKEHREYFAVEPERAHAVQEVWRDFVLHEPYNSEGYLTPFWDARLKAWATYGRHAASDEGDDGESAFRRQLQHWYSFANPNFLEFLWYDLSGITARIWIRKWQALAFLQGFIIACLSFPSFFAFVCFAGLALAILVEACFSGDFRFRAGGDRLYSISGLMNGTRMVVRAFTR